MPIWIAFSIAVPLSLYVLGRLGYLDYTSILAAITLIPLGLLYFWFAHRMCDYVELMNDHFRISDFNGYGKRWREIPYGEIEEVTFDNNRGVVEISYRVKPESYVVKARIEMDQMDDFISELGRKIEA